MMINSPFQYVFPSKAKKGLEITVVLINILHDLHQVNTHVK